MPRDRDLVHGYDAIDPAIVWYIVKEKLPVLRVQLEALLGQAL